MTEKLYRSSKAVKFFPPHDPPVTADLLRLWIERGVRSVHLGGVRLGAHWHVSQEACRRFVEECTNGGKPLPGRVEGAKKARAKKKPSKKAEAANARAAAKGW
jgi:hypothetical protein